VGTVHQKTMRVVSWCDVERQKFSALQLKYSLHCYKITSLF